MLLKLDDDVYVRPERLEVPSVDYTGHTFGWHKFSAGAAYWLSAHSMDILMTNWDRRSTSEDVCVGETLTNHGVTFVDDPRYRIGWLSPVAGTKDENEFPHPDNDAITFHMYFPNWMTKMHSRWDQEKMRVDIYHFNTK